MSRLLRTCSEIDEPLAARVADVLGRGLYEVVPPSDDEIRITEDLSAESDVERLHNAACLLRCDRARNADGGLLPDVRISWGPTSWIHYPGIAEGEPAQDRIDAVGREHATIAARVLGAPLADERTMLRIGEIHDALAASCDGPSKDEPLLVDAATPWTPLRVNRFRDEIVPSPVQPDDDLCRIAPQIAWAGLMNAPEDERPVIRIDAYQTMLGVQDVPDPMTIIRTVVELRAQGAREAADEAAEPSDMLRRCQDEACA